MGQAKIRGSFEVRKQEGEARREVEARRLEEERIAAEAALTPAQRAKRQRASLLFGAILGLAGPEMAATLRIARTLPGRTR